MMPSSSRKQEALIVPAVEGALDRSFGAIMLKILVRDARRIVLISLAFAAALIVAYHFLTRPYFLSTTYISASSETLARMNVLLQSPQILDPAAERAGLDVSSHDVARLYMNDRISFKPAPGGKFVASGGPKDVPIFVLAVKDPDPQDAHDISNLIIAKWRDGLTPPSIEKEKIEADLDRQMQKKSELDDIIGRFGKQVTSYVTPQTNSGEVATPFVSLLNQRADLAKRIEDLRYELDGKNAFIIVDGPTRPDYARRPISRATLVIGSIFGSFLFVAGIFILIVFWRKLRASTSLAS